LNSEKVHNEELREVQVREVHWRDIRSLDLICDASLARKPGILTFRDVEFKSVPLVGLLYSEIVFLGNRAQ
jgi:hypothetical protein